ncbi:MAG: hypothetical protein R3A52_05770 [Polyangiales bacterium]
MRDRHALAAARVALAAGARDLTVRFVYGGDDWVGALLDASGLPRPAAARWSELFAWADTLPAGDELGERRALTADVLARAQASVARAPVAGRALAAIGFDLAELSPIPDVDVVSRWVDARRDRGAPWGSAPAPTPTERPAPRPRSSPRVTRSSARCVAVATRGGCARRRAPRRSR